MATSFRESLSSGQQWFNNRPVRERVLIAATALVVLLVVGWEATLTPVLAEKQRLESTEAALLNSRESLLQQRLSLNEQLATDPSAALRDQLSMRQQKLEQLDQKITEATDQLIAPQAMVTLLRDMLAAQTSLKLQSLELKSPTPVFAADPSGAGQEDAPRQPEEPLLYAHDVELKIKGSYLEVLAYLEHLEALDKRLGWVFLNYDAASWPAGEAVIQVRTLGFERAWLGV